VAFVNSNVDESEHEQISINVGVDDSENLENENGLEHDSQHD
jgi:hypothetical protein